MVDAKLNMPAVSTDIIFLVISPAQFKYNFLYPADFYRGRCPYSYSRCTLTKKLVLPVVECLNNNGPIEML